MQNSKKQVVKCLTYVVPILILGTVIFLGIGHLINLTVNRNPKPSSEVRADINLKAEASNILPVFDPNDMRLKTPTYDHWIVFNCNEEWNTVSLLIMTQKSTILNEESISILADFLKKQDQLDKNFKGRLAGRSFNTTVGMGSGCQMYHICEDKPFKGPKVWPAIP